MGKSFLKIHLYADLTDKNILPHFFNTQYTVKRRYLTLFVANHFLKAVSMDAVFFPHNLEQRLKVFSRGCVVNYST